MKLFVSLQRSDVTLNVRYEVRRAKSLINYSFPLANAHGEETLFKEMYYILNDKRLEGEDKRCTRKVIDTIFYYETNRWKQKHLFFMGMIHQLWLYIFIIDNESGKYAVSNGTNEWWAIWPRRWTEARTGYSAYESRKSVSQIGVRL